MFVCETERERERGRGRERDCRWETVGERTKAGVVGGFLCVRVCVYYVCERERECTRMHFKAVHGSVMYMYIVYTCMYMYTHYISPTAYRMSQHIS